MAVDFEQEAQIAIIRINRPEAMNALDPETVEALNGCWQRVRDDDAVRVVILTGAGERAFCAGADLKKTMPPAESFAQLSFGKDGGGDRWLWTEKPVIAAINGLALGGGLELALRCDIRIAATSAKFGLTEVRIGSMPGAGGTQRLPRLVGLTPALMMMMTGDIIDAEEAFRIGLVSKVTPADNLLDEARALAGRIAANAPLAVRAVKKLAYQSLSATLEAGLEAERLTMGVLRDTKDRIEGRLAFQQKRKPVFRGE